MIDLKRIESKGHKKTTTLNTSAGANSLGVLSAWLSFHATYTYL